MRTGAEMGVCSAHSGFQLPAALFMALCHHRRHSASAPPNQCGGAARPLRQHMRQAESAASSSVAASPDTCILPRPRLRRRGGGATALPVPLSERCSLPWADSRARTTSLALTSTRCSASPTTATTGWTHPAAAASRGRASTLRRHLTRRLPDASPTRHVACLARRAAHHGGHRRRMPSLHRRCLDLLRRRPAVGIGAH